MQAVRRVVGLAAWVYRIRRRLAPNRFSCYGAVSSEGFRGRSILIPLRNATLSRAGIALSSFDYWEGEGEGSAPLLLRAADHPAVLDSPTVQRGRSFGFAETVSKHFPVRAACLRIARRGVRWIAIATCVVDTANPERSGPLECSTFCVTKARDKGKGGCYTAALLESSVMLGNAK
jgi:hypothetical protein